MPFGKYWRSRPYQLDVAAANPHVFAVDWHAATIMDDLEAYAAAYYPAVTDLNVAAGTFTGDFIHPDGTVAPSAQDIGKALLGRVLGVEAAVPSEKTAMSTELASLRGLSQRPLALLYAGQQPSPPYLLDAVYRDPSATNLRPGLSGLITASTTSDAHGKYYVASNFNFTLGGVTGVKMLVVRIGPQGGAWVVRANDARIVLYDPYGQEMTTTGTRQVGRAGQIDGSEPVFIAIPISQTAANGYLTLGGRIYEAFLSDATVPLVGALP